MLALALEVQTISNKISCGNKARWVSSILKLLSVIVFKKPSSNEKSYSSQYFPLETQTSSTSVGSFLGLMMSSSDMIG